jgi:hypothetical protein
MFAVLLFWGCHEFSPPPTGLEVTDAHPDTIRPPSGSLSSGWLWFMVVDEFGFCIEGATASVVDGQALGTIVPQKGPCGPWDYFGGIEFRGLTEGVEMTIRLSAPGYSDKELTLIPASAGQSASIMAFELSPAPPSPGA